MSAGPISSRACHQDHCDHRSSRLNVVLLACGSYNPVTNMHLRMFEIARDQLERTGRYTVVGGVVSPVSSAYVKKDLVSAEHRRAMLELALKNSDWIKLDPWESQQATWIRTVNILRHQQAKLDSAHNANLEASMTSPPATQPMTSKVDQETTPPSRKRKHKDNCDTTLNGPSPKYSPELLGPGPLLRDGPPRIKLLCGADLLESFAVPDLWAKEDMEEIVGTFGVVCITREGTDAEKFIYESDLLTKYRENIVIVNEWITNDISSTKIRRCLRRGESVKYLLQDTVIDYINEHKLYTN